MLFVQWMALPNGSTTQPGQPLTQLEMSSGCQAAMSGKGAFLNFLKFLNSNHTACCGFMLQTQTMKQDQLRKVSWRVTKKADEVGDTINTMCWECVAGNGTHKRNLFREVNEEVQDVKPEGASHYLNIDPTRSVVAAVTLYARHRCMAKLNVGNSDEQVNAGNNHDAHSTSDCTSLPESLTSAAGLQRAYCSKLTNCGPSSKAIARQLQCQHGEQFMATCNIKQLQEKLAPFGVQGDTRVKQVRRVLLARGSTVDDTTCNEMLQAGVANARKDGDYAELIEANGAEVTFII